MSNREMGQALTDEQLSKLDAERFPFEFAGSLGEQACLDLLASALDRADALLGERERIARLFSDAGGPLDADGLPLFRDAQLDAIAGHIDPRFGREDAVVLKPGEYLTLRIVEGPADIGL